MELEIVHAKSNKAVASLQEIPASATVGEVKEAIAQKCRRYRDINRQELRLEPKGKGLKNESTLTELEVNSGAMLYFKDRGLQIGWSTVFLAEYAGPLLVYMWIYTRPWLFFGEVSKTAYSPGGDTNSIFSCFFFVKKNP